MNTQADPLLAIDALNRLVQALHQAEYYPHPVEPIRMIETHISIILLTGRYAYKFKKPLDLGFLDFSSLQKRHFCCQEELRINRRLAPQLYLEVVSIGGRVDEPRLYVEPAIEYAVRMKQFSQEALFDQILARQALRPNHIDRAAAVLARFHQSVERATAAQPFGEPQRVMQPVEENFAQLRDILAMDEYEMCRALNRIEDWSQHEFSRLAGLIGERKARGFVRECHGDAHLGNMLWLDDECVFFDGIEFNPSLRWIDVLSEAAFLSMDLMARGSNDLSARFLNHYLSHTGDYAGSALLPFYLSYRAMVRAKVAAIRRQQNEVGNQAYTEASQELETYLALALHYSERTHPRLVITLGVSGSGKSWITQPLLERLGAIRLRSDVERKRLFGLAAEPLTRTGLGQGIYTRRASEQTYQHLLDQARHLLQAGITVIVDATFLRREQRRPFERLAADMELPLSLLSFSAAADVLRQRVQHRLDQGRDASEANLAVLEAQLKTYEPPIDDERPMLIEIDSTQVIDIEALASHIQTR